LRDERLLSRVICHHVAQQERQDDVPVDEAELPAAFTDPEHRQIDEPTYPCVIHGPNDVLNTIAQGRVRTQGIAGAQRAQDRILTPDGALNRCILRHIANHQAELGMLDVKLVGVTNECANRVAEVKRLPDYLAPGRT
jgi:hypothetical protein